MHSVMPWAAVSRKARNRVSESYVTKVQTEWESTISFV